MKPLRAVSVLLLLCMIAPLTPAQSKVHSTVPRSKPVSMADVVRMTKAGVSDDVIIEQLKASKETFLLSTDDILQLKNAKVSDRVIAVMINPNYRPSQPAAAANKAAAAQTPAASKPGEESNAVALSPDGWPTEIGIYVKVKGEWTKLTPEVVNWKSGGMAKSLASGGIVKGDLNGYVDGSSSKVRAKNPLDLVIVLPEGFQIADFQLMHLHDHEDYRAFRTASGGVFHVSGGDTRDVVPFEGVKVAPHTYHATTSISLGEYGILAPGALTSMNGGSAAKIYTFGMIEHCGYTIPACE
jgi:hypothetical protein